MKADIHPAYQTVEVVCACGSKFETRSTKPVMKLEICSACHPYYTGTQKFLDAAGRIDRFNKRFAKTEGKMVKRAPVKTTQKKVTTIGKKQAPAKVLSTAPRKDKDGKPEKKKAA